jgi:signal recognition particle receptor subunit alpha
VLLQRKLMERNVAEEIAGKVVDSVAQSLEGQKLSSFTGGCPGHMKGLSV